MEWEHCYGSCLKAGHGVNVTQARGWLCFPAPRRSPRQTPPLYQLVASVLNASQALLAIGTQYYFLFFSRSFLSLPQSKMTLQAECRAQYGYVNRPATTL
jgi:hypothetical protein